MLNVINDETLYTKEEVERKWPLSFIGVYKVDGDPNKCRVYVEGDDYLEVSPYIRSIEGLEFIPRTREVLFGVDLYNVEKGGMQNTTRIIENSPLCHYAPAEECWADQFILYETVFDEGKRMQRVRAVADNVYDMIYYAQQNPKLRESMKEWGIIRGFSKTNVIGMIPNLGYIIGICDDDDIKDGEFEEEDSVLNVY